MHMPRLRKAAAVLILCATCLVLACSGGRQQETVAPLLDLLTLSPPIRGVHVPIDRAPRLEWRFDGSIPQEWKAEPAGGVIEQAADGLVLRLGEGRPWLEYVSDVDPLRYGRLDVTIKSKRPQRLECYFSTENPPRYHEGNNAVVNLLPDEETVTCRIQLPLPDACEEPIRAMRLYPCSRRGRLSVEKIVLVPRAPHFIQRKILSRDLLDVRQEYRRCWRFFGSGLQEVKLEVPETASSLRFTSGTLVGAPGSGLRVEVQQNSEPPRTLLQTTFGSALESWQEHRVDLTPWQGTRISLLFRVTAGDDGGIRLIGTPMVMGPQPEETRNVLLILVDTLRADRLSLYGHDRRTSPHLEKLARDGVVFSRPTAPSSWTIPSIASLFTGRYPASLGIGWGQGGRLPGDVPTLAERFSMAGFSTAAFVANFVLDIKQGYARGFQTFYQAPYKQYQMSAGDLNRRAVNWLRAHRDERMFCYIHYMDPHSPYSAPAPHGTEAGVSFTPGSPSGWTEGNIWPLVVGNDRVEDPGEISRIRRFYDEEVSYTDHHVGRLLAELNAEGLLEDLVVMVTADHGEELYDHRYWSHGYTLYEESVHVPLLVSAPGLRSRAGTVSGDPVSLIDVPPTLLELAGVIGPSGARDTDGLRDPTGAADSPGAVNAPRVNESPDTGKAPGAAHLNDGFDGRSLLSSLAERPLFSRTSTAGAPVRLGVRRGFQKYVFFNRQETPDQVPDSPQGRWLLEHGPAREEFFDLVEDPGELRNLHGTRADLETELREILIEWLSVTGQDDPLPSSGGEGFDEEMGERLRALGYIE